MFLNDTKGSFGMFSRAGRNSTEKFHILVKKEEILSGKKRKAMSTDMFGDPKKPLNSDDEEDDLLKIEIKNKTKIPSVVIETKKKVYASLDKMSEDKKKFIEQRMKKKTHLAQNTIPNITISREKLFRPQIGILQ